MKFLVTLIFSFFTFAAVEIHAEENAEPKKAKWCCVVDGKTMRTDTNKKMCVRSSLEPSEESKSKLAKKYAKSCMEASGAWKKGKAKKPKKD